MLQVPPNGPVVKLYCLSGAVKIETFIMTGSLYRLRRFFFTTASLEEPQRNRRGGHHFYRGLRRFTQMDTLLRATARCGVRELVAAVNGGTCYVHPAPVGHWSIFNH